MINLRCRAILFDLDGVLIDSTPAVARVWHRWAIEHGFDPERVVKMAHGRPSRTTIRELLPNADVEVEDREEDRWTIATSGTRPLAEVRLRAAGLPIPKTMITSSEVKLGKPDPEPYLKAAAVLGYAASDCVVVEDAPAGIRSGKSAGSRVIAFTTTMPQSELEAAGANWVVRNCTDIGARVEGAELVLSLDDPAR
jgi:sugar-phosphatase